MASTHFPAISLSQSHPFFTRNQHYFVSSLPEPLFISNHGFERTHGSLSIDSRQNYVKLGFHAGNRRRRRRRSHSSIRAESTENGQLMVPPYNVLITGSTKGIGFALAKEFLKAGDNVVICSRSVERVESAQSSDISRRVWGVACVGLHAMFDKGRM